MSYAQRLVKGSLWIFAMYFASGIISTILRIFLARNLTIEEFGMFYAVLSVSGFLLIFKDLGLSQTMTKFIAEFNAEKDRKGVKSVIYSALAMQFLLAFFMTSAVFLAAPTLAQFYFKNAGAEEPLRLIMLSYLFSVFVSLQYALQGLGKIELYSVIEPLRNILTLVAAVFLIHMGAVGVAQSYLAGTIIISVIIFLFVLKSFPFFSVAAGIERAMASRLWHFSAPLFVANIGGVALNYFDTILITAMLSLGSVALYQVALPTSQIIWALMGSASIVILPIISELWARKDSAMIRKMLGLIVKFYFVFSIPFIIPVVAFPEIIIRMLFGEQYLGAAAALQILVINSVFYAVFWILSTAMIAVGEPKTNRNIVLLLGATNVFLNLALIPVLGIEGAALAALLSYIIGASLMIRHLAAKSLITIHAHDIVKSMFGGAISFAAMLFIKSFLDMNAWIEAAAAVLCGAAIYALFLFATKTVKKEELAVLKKGGIPIPSAFLR
ncbi:MAG: flippase [Candidatus Aenigmarchaeota archaeon]|nr:flippase [Candidatus Aenigmarchaeota archaeon]